MGKQISVPDADLTVQWTKVPPIAPNHYGLINEDWGSPFTGERVEETVNYQQEQFSFPADGPAAMVTVHTIHTDLYINTTDITQLPGLAVMIYLGVTWHAAKNFNVDTGGAWQKRRFTIDGLSLTKAQYDTVNIHLLTIAGDVSYPTPPMVE